MYNFQLSIQH